MCCCRANFITINYALFLWRAIEKTICFSFAHLVALDSLDYRLCSLWSIYSCERWVDASNMFVTHTEYISMHTTYICCSKVFFVRYTNTNATAYYNISLLSLSRSRSLLSFFLFFSWLETRKQKWEEEAKKLFLCFSLNWRCVRYFTISSAFIFFSFFFLSITSF